jgi:hypothetical protein
MNDDQKFDGELIMQPIKPGMTVPEELGDEFLYLVNLNRVAQIDVWDDYGNKENAQARQLRSFADRILAIAEKLEQLGPEFKRFPDANDYDENSVESMKVWDEVIAEANAAFAGGYRDIADLIDELTEAAIGDFMD